MGLPGKAGIPIYAMSDEEEVDTTFESADAGASTTYPMQAGSIRKGGHICIKGRPCKVVDVSTSKTGKHGHAKCKFVAIDIFTGNKMEDMQPSSHNAEVPNVKRTEYQLLDIDEDDDYVSLMTEEGDTKDDLKLPADPALRKAIQEAFEAGNDVFVIVIAAMGEEMIHSMKEKTDG